MDNLTLPFGENFEQAWLEWLQYRKENKFKKYVPTGIKRTLTGLVRDSGDNEQIAIAIIHQSIEKGYQGLFPLKNNYGSNTITTQKVNSKSAGFEELAALFRQDIGVK